ncbi:MAG: SdpI family protein [Lachnospiraceae bacterium]|nr:SdpI family protein [Lachnospiraceae bacterium]
MIRKNKWQLIISSVIIILPIVVGLFIWNYLPEQIAIHWGVDGEPDGWSGKSFAVWGLPLILLALHWICIFFTAHDPKNKEQSSKVFNMVLWIIPIISLIVCSCSYAFALGNDINIVMICRVLIGIIFVIIGNYMPKCKQNYTIGIKIPWTLQNEENWNKTHRFAGRIEVLGGLLILATLFIPMENFIYVLIPLILLMAFVPIIYSYVYYRKQAHL